MPGHGPTPLIFASENGNVEIVKLLVENAPSGNDKRYYIDHTDHNSYTALHHATAKGHLEVVKILVELGNAKVETTSPYIFGYYTEAKYAAWEKSHKRSAIRIAQEKGHQEIVDYLNSRTQTSTFQTK
jgi:ankyrin repeat protein